MSSRLDTINFGLGVLSAQKDEKRKQQHPKVSAAEQIFPEQDGTGVFQPLKKVFERYQTHRGLT
jgi:hypothetical protein